MRNQAMQVIGLCRFSYPALGGFQIEHDTIEERTAFLYAPARMEERFRTFTTLTLPALRAQSDPDFTLVIIVGDSMPEPLLSRLLDLTEDMPQMVILPRPPGRHRAVMRAVINMVREDRPVPSLQFRMDDDDAVSLRFVERLRAAGRDIAPLLSRHRYVGIDFNHGYIARLSSRGIAAKPVTEPLWTPALGMAVAPGASRSIMNFNHANLGRVMPVLSLPDEAMFIRGHNEFNDSRQKDGVKPVHLPMLDCNGEARLKRDFNIDADQVRSLYSE